MPYDEYGFGLHVGSCPSCGAGLGNHYQHHEDCLINVPDRKFELVPYWNSGWNTYLKHDGPDKSDSDLPEGKAFLMGFRSAMRLQQEGRLPADVSALLRTDAHRWSPVRHPPRFA